MPMSEQAAIALVCEFIRRGEIHLPCLDKFESFRKKELQHFLANDDLAYNWSLDGDRKKLAAQAARLDSEYLCTLVESLKQGTDTKLDTGNFCIELRKLDHAIKNAQHG